MTEAVAAQPQSSMKAQPSREHAWLAQLVGEWTYETVMTMEPGQAPPTFVGIERIRAVGDLWIVAEGHGQMPDGAVESTLITLGYDPQRQRFVGTWLGSMMTHLWLCDGTLDADERTLTLDSEGPSFEVEGKMATYQDIITLISSDHRTLTARALGQNGQWIDMMTTHYRRTT